MPLQKVSQPNFDMCNDFYVASTGNILTLFLLQIAFTFADRVDIYGCDGRPLNENNYFWKHDKTAQLNERMDDIQRAHPGFFRISYDDYYEEHCGTLDSFLKGAEELGKIAVSKTFSHIPALVERALPAEDEAGIGGASLSSLSALQYSNDLLLHREAFIARMNSDEGLREAVEQASDRQSPLSEHLRAVLRWVQTAR
ncbi:hypothetical protein GCM10011617_00070 [Novosphingobium arvoryzae]|uniref:Uncharacterized protein n=1 Tax=Novosphingobium arvoryzae TaxID=1256514 RepID=A0A918R4C6_9SPHN|nr:hypothetical protein GCM10011617_00070 [Novosphingobium arvoryzae]